eukprot:5156563-Prorocentrum_lima.AAC.1
MIYVDEKKWKLDSPDGYPHPFFFLLDRPPPTKLSRVTGGGGLMLLVGMYSKGIIFYAWTPKVSVDKEAYVITCSEALPWGDFEAAFDDGAGVHDGIQADSVFESQGVTQRRFAPQSYDVMPVEVVHAVM